MELNALVTQGAELTEMLRNANRTAETYERMLNEQAEDGAHYSVRLARFELLRGETPIAKCSYEVSRTSAR